MKSSWNTLKWPIMIGGLLIIGLILAANKVMKAEAVISTFGSNTLAFGCQHLVTTNTISSDGTEKFVMRLEGKVVLTNLGFLVRQRIPVMIMHDTTRRELVWNSVRQGETLRAGGWHWTMFTRKVPITLLQPAKQGYKVSNRSCAYFWTDYDMTNTTSR